MDRSFKVFGYSLSVVIAIIFGTFGMLKVFPFLSPEINKKFVSLCDFLMSKIKIKKVKYHEMKLI